MKITVKRLNISLSHEDMRKLDELSGWFRETPTPTIRRCIEIAHTSLKTEITQTKINENK